MSTKPRGLGKGLSALMSESYGDRDASQAGQGARSLNRAQTEQNATREEMPSQAGPTEAGTAQAEQGSGAISPTLLPVGKLQASRYQPRRHFDEQALRELATSIEKNGMMQPILVRPIEAERYEIIAGERRWRAAQIARLDMVPVLVRELSDRQALELAIVENVQRQDLNAVEEALGYQRLMDEFGYTQEKVAATIGKSRSHVANALRLLGLPASVRVLLEEAKISAGHARALLGTEHAETLAMQVVQQGLSVRQTEDLVRGGAAGTVTKPKEKTTPPRRAAGGEKDGDILALEEALSGNLGLSVQIVDRGQSGDIVITYQTLSELDSILKRLGGGI